MKENDEGKNQDFDVRSRSDRDTKKPDLTQSDSPNLLAVWRTLGDGARKAFLLKFG